MGGFDLVVVTGPTASGKTALAAELASRLKGEVISADSRQVYRGMDIGTGKDYDDYIVNGVKIPVHLIDIADPGYKYNVFEYQKDFLEVYTGLKKRGVFPVVCGGSGMYIDSIVSGYNLIEVPPDPFFRKEMEKKSMTELIQMLKSYKTLHNKTDTDSKKRIIRALEIEHYYHTVPGRQQEFTPVRSLIVGVHFERESRRERISQRLKDRIGKGMIEEVRLLLDQGIDSDSLIYYGLEYRFITLFLLNRISYQEMLDQLEIAIHQYAKRQMTWFRGMERKGIRIKWIDGNLPDPEKADLVLDLLSAGE